MEQQPRSRYPFFYIWGTNVFLAMFLNRMDEDNFFYIFLLTKQHYSDCSYHKLHALNILQPSRGVQDLGLDRESLLPQIHRTDQHQKFCSQSAE